MFRANDFTKDHTSTSPHLATDGTRDDQTTERKQKGAGKKDGSVSRDPQDKKRRTGRGPDSLFLSVKMTKLDYSKICLRRYLKQIGCEANK